MDEYCLLVLLWLFNPILTARRGLQQASELDKVRKRLGVGRASLGSLSESVRIVDPEPLRQIAVELTGQVPHAAPGRFDPVGQTLTAVDRSVIETVVKVAQLAWLPKSGGRHHCGYRLHTQFEVLRGTVSRVDVTGSKPKGDADERAVLERTVEPDRCYLIDRATRRSSPCGMRFIKRAAATSAACATTRLTKSLKIANSLTMTVRRESSAISSSAYGTHPGTACPLITRHGW